VQGGRWGKTDTHLAYAELTMKCLEAEHSCRQQLEKIGWFFLVMFNLFKDIEKQSGFERIKCWRKDIGKSGEVTLHS
jgi:hypothetical protein